MIKAVKSIAHLCKILWCNNQDIDLYCMNTYTSCEIKLHAQLNEVPRAVWETTVNECQGLILKPAIIALYVVIMINIIKKVYICNTFSQ